MMTVSELCAEYGFEVLCLPEGEREVSGAYIGDLLSWVMGRATANGVWITIMSNINVVAVASLADVSCVLLAEGVSLDDEVAEMAKQKGVNVLKSDFPAFETAQKLFGKV